MFELMRLKKGEFKLKKSLLVHLEVTALTSVCLSLVKEGLRQTRGIDCVNWVISAIHLAEEPGNSQPASTNDFTDSISGTAAYTC